MTKVLISTLCFLAICTSVFAEEQTNHKIVSIEIPEDFILQTPEGEKDIGKIGEFSIYLEAYIRGMLDTKFPNSGTIVAVRNGDVVLGNLPEDKAQREAIINCIQELIGNSTNGYLSTVKVVEETNKNLEKAKYHGIWLPQSTILYPTQIANPRRVCFSGAIRLHDSIAGQTSTPVSFGDQFPLYRWTNFDIYNIVGDMQLEVDAAVFAVFNQTHSSSPLINADYYVGLPLSYAYDKWAHRLRVYHISSHLGDEFMLHRRRIRRLNKSYEAVDYSFSYDIIKEVRVYGVAGVIAHSDSEMPLRRLYGEYGMEVHVGRYEWDQLYGCPYLAMHFENWQDNDWKIDAYFSLGYEWGKINGMGKKIRAGVEYHSGYCDEGQFSRRRSDYVQFKLSYGF